MSKIMYLTSFTLLGCLNVISAADISFQEISGTETGLHQIMSDWHASELKRQGGKFVSHGWWPWGLTSIDIDNDGDIDLVPTHHGKPGGIILKSEFAQTGKHFYKNVTEEMGVKKIMGADKKPKVWDFNGDGFLDLAGFTDEGVAPSFLNIKGEKLQELAEHTFSPVSHHKDEQVRDMNGDGYLDFAGRFRERYVYKSWNSEKNTFVKFKNTLKKEKPNVPKDFLDYFAELKTIKHEKRGHLVNRFLYVKYLTDYDLNLDGKKDLIAQCGTAYGRDLPAAYFFGDGNGNYVDKTEELGLPKQGSPQIIQDLTGDGLPDICVVRKGDAGFYMATKEGGFTKPDNLDLNKALQEPGSYIQKIIPVDLDNDGDLDLVISLPREGRETIFQNQGNGIFKLILKFYGWDSEPLAICDLNNDGLLDIAAGGSGTKTGAASKKKRDITLFINNTQNDNNYCKIYPTMPAPNPYAVGAQITVFAAGTLNTEGAAPIVNQHAHPDASPVHVGLGTATHFDLRVRFPDGTVREFKNVKASNRIQVGLEGDIVEVQ